MTTRDHPRSKPHGPEPAGVGGPWNLKNHWISPTLAPSFWFIWWVKNARKKNIENHWRTKKPFHIANLSGNKCSIQQSFRMEWKVFGRLKVMKLMIYNFGKLRNFEFNFKKSIIFSHVTGMNTMVWNWGQTITSLDHGQVSPNEPTDRSKTVYRIKCASV